MPDLKTVIASALANNVGGRHGVPPVVNVLDMLPADLKEQFLGDAEEVIQAIVREPDAMAELRVRMAVFSRQAARKLNI